MNTQDRLKALAMGAGVILMLVLAVGVYRYTDAYASSIQPSSFRSVSVRGEGKVVVSPDIATFTYSVITEGGTDLSALMTQNDTKGKKAIDFVKAQGIKAEDIKTEQFGVEPRYQYANCGGQGGGVCPPPTIVGYTVRQTVSVKIRKDNFGKVGTLLSGVVGVGANSVSQIAFTLDDPAKAEAEARAKAFTQAREKADALASAGKFSVGRLLNVSEGGYSPRYYAADSYALGKGGGGMMPAPATIEPGSQDIVINLSLQYEIR